MTYTGEHASSLAIERYLRDLGEVSYRHGFAIGDRGEVFVMEGDDFSSRYILTSGDYLSFGS